jgi:hypothetical protein
MRIAPADIAAAKEPGNGSDQPSGGGATTRAEEQGTPGRASRFDSMVKGRSIWQSMHQIAQSAAETITGGLVRRKAPPVPKNSSPEDEEEQPHMDAHNILLVAKLKVRRPSPPKVIRAVE